MTLQAAQITQKTILEHVRRISHYLPYLHERSSKIFAYQNLQNFAKRLWELHDIHQQIIVDNVEFTTERITQETF